MAIATGSLVDDAIIYVENTYRQLRKNVMLPLEERIRTTDVVFSASSEMRSSIVNATFIIIITFFPLFLLEGFEGRMLRPLGITFIVSLFASLIVAVTVTPALCVYLLGNESRLIREAKGTMIERTLSSVSRKILGATLGRNRMVLLVTSLLLVVAIILFIAAGSTFLPSFNEGALTINIRSMPGISLEESAKAGKKAQAILLTIPEVTSVSCKTGRERDLPYTPSVKMCRNLMFLSLSATEAGEEFFADVRGRLKMLKGIETEVGKPV
jgi:Cu/Ag efflux pump CusA